jgi:hypothetical protein
MDRLLCWWRWGELFPPDRHGTGKSVPKGARAKARECCHSRYNHGAAPSASALFLCVPPPATGARKSLLGKSAPSTRHPARPVRGPRREQPPTHKPAKALEARGGAHAARSTIPQHYY